MPSSWLPADRVIIHGDRLTDIDALHLDLFVGQHSPTALHGSLSSVCYNESTAAMAAIAML